jgi:hypothetical protein
MNWRRFFERDKLDAEQRIELESYVELTTALESVPNGNGSRYRKRGRPTNDCRTYGSLNADYPITRV